MGGIGSASVILALRSTMENVIGGLLLKLEDKIRVGEVITVPGDGKKTGTVSFIIYFDGNVCEVLRKQALVVSLLFDVSLEMILCRKVGVVDVDAVILILMMKFS